MSQPLRPQFILCAFDLERLCPVLAARFEANPDLLHEVLEIEKDYDPDLLESYLLNSSELSAVISRFSVPFDPSPLRFPELEFWLQKKNPDASEFPYLGHMGFELPLLLDGQKKLANMYAPYPPMTFDDEERFEYWVARGALHREEILKPFEEPVHGYEGIRTVYYTQKGKEWRIPAMQLIWQAAQESGGWNEYFERLEGMLYGYTDFENDMWIKKGKQRGGFGGMALCCSVTEAGLVWLEAAGYRALPPCEDSALEISIYDHRQAVPMPCLVEQKSRKVAVVCFRLSGKDEILASSRVAPGRWSVPSERVSALNRSLRAGVVLLSESAAPNLANNE